MSEELNDVMRWGDVPTAHVFQTIRCRMAAVMIAAFERDAVDSQTFDEVCNRYSAECSIRAGWGYEEVAWTVLNVARRVRAEVTNDIDPAEWNTPVIRQRMVRTLHYIASNPDNLDLPPHVVLRVPEAVEQALQWFGEVWSADALLTERPLWQVIKPVLYAASFYSELDGDEE